MVFATSILLTLHLGFLNGVPSTTIDDLPRRGTLGLPLSPVAPDIATKNNLKLGEGVISQAPVPGLTAERAGIRAGDIITSVNGSKVITSQFGAMIRDLRSGESIKFSVLRDGKTIELSTVLQEKPRDPGNANYEVIYSHIVSNGKKMRTIITKPRKAGKYPGFMFIQGLAPISYDFTLEGSSGDVTQLDGPILFEFANSGFVTIRVEKPGVGDSEGGPYPQTDYITELDIYRQTLRQLKEIKEVDTENIFIFGHSMGGSFGPMVASEIPVKGIAVYGVAARTWYEYLLDILRYQGLVGGGSFENADDSVRQGAQLMSLIYMENKSVEEVKKSHPHLAPLAESLMPGGLFNGKAPEFWRQLAKINFASYWTKCSAHVLAARGESDFVTYDVDHKLISDVVNRARPGFGKSIVVPSSDHLFHNFPTEVESMKNFSKGQFNPTFTSTLKAWIQEVMSKP